MFEYVWTIVSSFSSRLIIRSHKDKTLFNENISIHILTEMPLKQLSRFENTPDDLCVWLRLSTQLSIVQLVVKFLIPHRPKKTIKKYYPAIFKIIAPQMTSSGPKNFRYKVELSQFKLQKSLLGLLGLSLW